MGEFCLLAELHREGSAPAACAAGLFNDLYHFKTILVIKAVKKSRIRETKHLSTDADSSIDAIGGWTKNNPKPDFFEKRKKSSKMQKLKNL